MPSPEELHLIAHLHGGFPLVDRPYAEVARQLGCSEDMLLARLRSLLARGDLSRFGPLFQIERAGGRFVLAAMAVPEARFDAVALRVNARPEVAHNYRRSHRLNMWFVVAADSAQSAQAVLDEIAADSGLEVLAFPKEREFFVELKLPLLAQEEGGPHEAR